MKKIMSLLLSVLMLFTTITAVPFVGCAKEQSVKKYGIFIYKEISKNEVEIVASDLNASNVTVPSKINGKKVTVIGENAFYGSSMKSIVVPDTVTEIKSWAFFKCENLDNIKLSKNLKKIGSGVLSISKYYFNKKNWHNGGLYLDNYLFAVEDEYLFDSEYKITKLNVKKGTKVIAESAAEFCRNIKSVTIPSSVKYIGEYAFWSCWSLKSLSIANGVKTIGKKAFDDCLSLKTVKIPSSVTSIGAYAFGYKDPDIADEKPIKMKNITIKGYTNTAAQKYAKKNKIKFSAVLLKTPNAKITAGKKKLTVKYTKVSGASGFEVKYTKGKKTVTKTFKTSKSAAKTIAKLKKGKYKVQVRAYYMNSKKQKAYSPWTKAKSVTVK